MIHREGRNIVNELIVRLHFPESITPEEREEITKELRFLIPHQTKILLEVIIKGRTPKP